MRQLSDESLVTKWAYPAYRAQVFSRPARSARKVTRLKLLTADQFPQPYIVLADWTDTHHTRWFKIRLPSRPNGRTGWVPDRALGRIRAVRTMLRVNRVVCAVD